MLGYYEPYWDQPNELEHFGVKGMKWGVRWYQNADGTLTEAGKKRRTKDYLKAGKKLKKIDRKASRIANTESPAMRRANAMAREAGSRLFNKAPDDDLDAIFEEVQRAGTAQAKAKAEMKQNLGKQMDKGIKVIRKLEKRFPTMNYNEISKIDQESADLLVKYMYLRVKSDEIMKSLNMKI